MPLIEINVLPRDDIDRASISRAVSAAVAAAIPCRLEAVWTTWRTIDGPFARGDEVSTPQTTAAFGPIVHVYHHRAPDQVERAVEAIETVLADALTIERSQVFVTTQPVVGQGPALDSDDA